MPNNLFHQPFPQNLSPLTPWDMVLDVVYFQLRLQYSRIEQEQYSPGTVRLSRPLDTRSVKGGATYCVRTIHSSNVVCQILGMSELGLRRPSVARCVSCGPP